MSRRREANAGERLAFARLPTGVRVIGVNAGYAFSFVRDAAEDLRWAAVPASGSQFRSRDLFPQAAAAIALGHPNALAETIDPGQIPAVPEGAIAYIDGYGNLKTTLRVEAQPYAAGTSVRLRIGGHEHGATAGDGTFSVTHGQMAFAPGSSGWAGRTGSETHWIEIFLRGGNAWETFQRPGIGDQVELLD
jgi:S-adenosylmethionine hydrolase